MIEQDPKYFIAGTYTEIMDFQLKLNNWNSRMLIIKENIKYLTHVESFGLNHMSTVNPEQSYWYIAT